MRGAVGIQRRAAAALAACVAEVGPVRDRRGGGMGGREYWDQPLRDALRTASPAARAHWAEAERLWWELALSMAHVARREARAARRGLRGTALDIEDLVSAGMVGLYRAAQRWDPNRSSSWQSYATIGCRMWVRRELTSARRLSTQAQGQVWDLVRRLQVQDARGIPGGVRAAAAWCEIDHERARRLLTSDVSRDAYLDAPLPDAEKRTLRDTIEADVDIEMVTEARETSERLAGAVAQLGSRMETIIRLRAEGLTNAEIGERLGIGRERVRQLGKTAIARLRPLLREAA